jgi:hypothetical protein
MNDIGFLALYFYVVGKIAKILKSFFLDSLDIHHHW